MSSSYAASPKKYDVFISFRGEDTRTNFTSHLHTALCDHKIETYIDYKLNKGEDVWPALSEAIMDSHVSVIVFSENYASSKWCLEEVVKIMDCRKNQGQVVIPVFYKADPSHIRKQTGSYGEAFARHELNLLNNESDQRKVSMWKSALTEAANISGWDSSNHENDSQVIKNITNDVLEKLHLRYPNEIQGLVGIDEYCRDIELLLKKFQVIGIWAMGGMGKTTIAKATFAKLFPNYDSVCFLANVRTESKKHGLTSLRDRLLFELLKEEKPKYHAVSSTFIMRRLQSKKVLIVLDDVDHFEQLEDLCGERSDLGPDSRLIITTRHRQLVTERVDQVYEVKKWDYQESLELFSLHAFKESQSQMEYDEDLVKEAVSYAGGTPLALKVLGRYFRSKDHKFWESELRKLKKYPNKEIRNVLQVSYDGLEELQQEIFLDIAFFFKDEDKDYVTRILDACGFYATSGIDILKDKALVTISNNNKIQMHDLLQEMGLDIVREEFKRDPGRRSRLRDCEEVSRVLQNEKGTDVVEGIMLDLSQIDDLHVSADTFNVMPNLRFLKLYIPLDKKSGNVHIPGVLKPFSDKLRYLEWNRYPLESLPQKFCAKLLVEFRMPHSHVTELWSGVQELVNLEGIDLSECKHLIKLPDLSRALKLKWVNLCGCEILCDLHPSILSRDTLVALKLDRCKNLKSVKSEKHLMSLQKISVNGCTSLKEFSVSSDLIERLDLSNAGIEMLHSSIGRLKNLKWFNLEGLRLKSLPDELGSLQSLGELRISKCKLVFDKQKLDILFDGLRSLRVLHLKDCHNLSELPDNISVLSCLRELRLDGSGVDRLPATIKHLQELEIISLENCRKLHCLPELPPFISECYATNCRTMVTVATLKTFASEMKGKEKFVSFMNDMKLDERSLQCIMEGAQLTMMSAAFHNVFVRSYNLTIHSHNYNAVKVCLPGSRVPGQFTYRTTESSLTVELPSHTHLPGLVLCAVLSPSPEMKEHGAKIFCQCYSTNGTMVGYATRWYDEAVKELNSDHVFVWYDPLHWDSIVTGYKRQLSFEFYVTDDKGERDGLSIVAKECGVSLIFHQEFHRFLLDLDLDLQSKLELGSDLASELGLEFGPRMQLELEAQHRAMLAANERSDEKETCSSCCEYLVVAETGTNVENSSEQAPSSQPLSMLADSLLLSEETEDIHTLRPSSQALRQGEEVAVMEIQDQDTTRVRLALSEPEHTAKLVEGIVPIEEPADIMLSASDSHVVPSQGDPGLEFSAELDALVDSGYLSPSAAAFLVGVYPSCPSVRVLSCALTQRLRGIAYGCLVDLLDFLKSHTLVQLLGPKRSEALEKLGDVQCFPFPKAWLDNIKRRLQQHVPDISQETLRSLLDSEMCLLQKANILQQKMEYFSKHLETLKEELDAVEAEHAQVVRSKNKLLQTKAAFEAPFLF